jgi:hypothetical protein
MSSNVKSRDLCFLLCCLSWASLTTVALMLGSHWCHSHMTPLFNNTSKCRCLCWMILSLKNERNLQIVGYMYPRLDLVVLLPNKITGSHPWPAAVLKYHGPGTYVWEITIFKTAGHQMPFLIAVLRWVLIADSTKESIVCFFFFLSALDDCPDKFWD